MHNLVNWVIDNNILRSINNKNRIIEFIIESTNVIVQCLLISILNEFTKELTFYLNTFIKYLYQIQNIKNYKIVLSVKFEIKYRKLQY